MKSLYVHIPFCKQKCFYCSFAVCVSHKQRRDLYVDCLIKEMSCYKKQRLASIYLGGGTPSTLTKAQLSKIFSAIRKYFLITKTAEITIEMNPEDVSSDYVKHALSLGINRFSLGVQVLNDKILDLCGRGHNAKMAEEAYVCLRTSGAKNVSVDLMSMFPGQTVRQALADLKKMIQWGVDHVSLYALTIEPNSQMYVKNVKLPSERMQREFFVRIKEECQRNGIYQYEVSNFARFGYESRHNMNYWQGGEYIGIGMAAHSHIKGRRYWNVGRLMKYVDRISQEQSVLEGEEVLSKYERFIESIIFGLRMSKGVNVAFLEKKFKVKLDCDRMNLIKALMDEGYLLKEKSNLKVSHEGMLVLDEISSRLV